MFVKCVKKKYIWQTYQNLPVNSLKFYDDEQTTSVTYIHVNGLTRNVNVKLLNSVLKREFCIHYLLDIAE